MILKKNKSRDSNNNENKPQKIQWPLRRKMKNVAMEINERWQLDALR